MLLTFLPYFFAICTTKVSQVMVTIIITFWVNKFINGDQFSNLKVVCYFQTLLMNTTPMSFSIRFTFIFTYSPLNLTSPILICLCLSVSFAFYKWGHRGVALHTATSPRTWGHRTGGKFWSRGTVSALHPAHFLEEPGIKINSNLLSY